MRFEHEAAPFRVNERMALATVDLLSSIITAWPAGLGGLGALAVDDCRRGAGVAPDPFAICHHERVVYPFKAPVVAPGGEPAVNRPPWWQVVRQQAPRAARPHDIENAVDDLAHRPLAWPARRAGLRQVRRDHEPLGEDMLRPAAGSTKNISPMPLLSLANDQARSWELRAAIVFTRLSRRDQVQVDGARTACSGLRSITEEFDTRCEGSEALLDRLRA